MCLNSWENYKGQYFNFKKLFYRGNDKGENDRGYYGNSTDGGLAENLPQSLIQESNEIASFAYIKSNQQFYTYF